MQYKLQIRRGDLCNFPVEVGDVIFTKEFMALCLDTNAQEPNIGEVYKFKLLACCAGRVTGYSYWLKSFGLSGRVAHLSKDGTLTIYLNFPNPDISSQEEIQQLAKEFFASLPWRRLLK